MPELKVGVEETRQVPTLDVEVNPSNPLPIGAHRFQLVVVDDTGNVSEPAVLEVIVRDTEKPTAVLDVVDANNKVLGTTVPFGKGFRLSGLRSTDNPPGKVVTWKFTLLDRA
jgi:hypothetical protein